MSRKRRNTSSPEPDGSPRWKRARSADSDSSDDIYEEYPTGNEQSKVDETYGQKYAFPGLGGDSDELFYGPATDGIEYLRMVRSEARTVPHVLVAEESLGPHKPRMEDGYNEGSVQYSGHFVDGVFTAISGTGSRNPSCDVPDAQEQYYTSLIARFALTRKSLTQTPPLAAIQALDSSHPVSFPPDSSAAKQQWRYNLQYTHPQPTQVACMDAASVLEMIRLLTNSMAATIRSRSRLRINRFGAWAWAVLGRARDRGELASEEIAELRELGKRAIALLEVILDRMRRNASDEGDSVHDCEENLEWHARDIVHGDVDNPQATGDYLEEKIGENEEEHIALEQAKARLSRGLTSDTCSTLGKQGEFGAHGKCEMDVDRRIRILLDMIITIIGDVYGQRDLLEFREMWE